MELNNIMIISGCILGIIGIGLIFKINILKIVKLILNSIIGAIIIFLINQIGAGAGLHIGMNVITSIFVGIFGIPGSLLLIALKIF